MTNLRTIHKDGQHPPDAVSVGSVDGEVAEDFSSLRRSLSCVHNSQTFFYTPSNVARRRSIHPSPVEPTIKPAILAPQPQPLHNHGLHIKIPQLSSAAQVALAALQHLPTPVLVLTSLKTVILANEAMGRLLGLNPVSAASDAETEHKFVHGMEYKGRSVTDVLKGQSLSQIGIDMIQNGQPVWVSWEKFLDKLAPSTQAHPRQKLETIRSEEATPTVGIPESAENDEDDEDVQIAGQKPKVQRPIALTSGDDTVHETAVDVVVSTQHTYQAGSKAKHARSPGHQVQAKMIITIWTLENQHYFTLTFTSPSPVAVNPRASQPQVPAIPSAAATSAASTRTKSPFSADSGRSSRPASSTSSSAVTSPSEATSAGPFPPLGPPAKCQKTDTPTMFEKVTRMKDAILSIDTINIPVFAMWHDESLAFPNGAARRLMSCDADPTSQDGYDFFSRFRVYTEDFERELSADEIPIIELCRTQKPFRTWKIGMIEPQTGRRINYDVSGEGIYDESTGEFLAGVIVMKDVTEYTERLAAQDEENEQQFQLICDTMPQMLWTCKPDGYHDYFSQRWYDYTGLNQKESMGKGWQLPFHEDDLPETNKKWAHCLATGDEYMVECRCRRYDGVWRWMLSRALPLRDTKTGEISKWFGSCTDIHDLVEARQVARRMREQLSNVIKHADVTVFAIDRIRRLTFFEGKMAWDAECKEAPGTIGQNIYDVISEYSAPEKLRTYREPLERILNGSTKIENAEYYVEESKRWYRARFVPVLGKKRGGGTMDQSYVDGAIGISMDVTELKEREKENVRLLSSEVAAKEASRLKSNFLANMSHEIRTPIAGIIGMSELMMDTPLNEEQGEFAQNIQRSANALLTVINDILDFSKVESGQLDIEEVQFSLAVVLQDVGKMLSFAAERKNLRFFSEIKLGQTPQCELLGDPGRVRQILTNLVTNSIKFTSEGYVKLTVGVKNETADVLEMFFSIEDTGIGIDEEVKKKLFSPFSQADSSTARKFGGTGLGLTICKNLVELMHGTISLKSVLGSGTTATFTIPFNKPQFPGTGAPFMDASALPDRLQSELSLSCNSSNEHAPTTPPVLSPIDRPAKSKLDKPPSAVDLRLQKGLGSPLMTPTAVSDLDRSKIRVLVVEDNAINQQIAMKTIRNLNFEVSAVWNGKEALEYLLQPSNPRPDVILMDCQMPILDGYHATHLIRHHAPYAMDPMIQAIPIVAMTASAIQGDREKCERAGMDDYLAKPVKRTILEKMLLKWIGRDRTLKDGMFSERQGAGRESICMNSEHGSECPITELAIDVLATQSAMKVEDLQPLSRATSAARSVDAAVAVSRKNAELLGTDNLPQVDLQTGLRSGSRDAEDRADGLRTNKLLSAGGDAPKLSHSMDARIGNVEKGESGPNGSIVSAEHDPTDQTASVNGRMLKLTEENMVKLARQHERQDKNLAEQKVRSDRQDREDEEDPFTTEADWPRSASSLSNRPILHPQLPLPVPLSAPGLDTEVSTDENKWGDEEPRDLDESGHWDPKSKDSQDANRSRLESHLTTPSKKKPWGPTRASPRRNDSGFSERSERTLVPERTSQS